MYLGANFLISQVSYWRCIIIETKSRSVSDFTLLWVQLAHAVAGSASLACLFWDRIQLLGSPHRNCNFLCIHLVFLPQVIEHICCVAISSWLSAFVHACFVSSCSCYGNASTMPIWKIFKIQYGTALTLNTSHILNINNIDDISYEYFGLRYLIQQPQDNQILPTWTSKST